eukprot:gene13156-3951_t
MERTKTTDENQSRGNYFPTTQFLLTTFKEPLNARIKEVRVFMERGSSFHGPAMQLLSSNYIISGTGRDDKSFLIGGSVALGILLMLLAIAIWWFIIKRRKLKQKNSKAASRPSEVLTKPPDIQVNKIEFTVPSSNLKHRAYDNLSPNEQTLPLIGPCFETSSNESLDSNRTPEGIPTAFGLLRPDLYLSDTESENSGFPPGHIGRIWFRLEFNCETENLFVTVAKIENLPARQHRGSSLSMSGASTCDSFVRIFLLPDEKRYLQTKVKKRTLNPKFNQEFAFCMSYSILRERTLRFSVFDVDRFTRQTVIGHALYSLENLDITMALDEWKDLEKVALPSTENFGEILISMTYLEPINRMAVTVVKATGLHLVDFQILNPYVKVSHSVLGKVTKTKKTPVHKENSYPEFDYCFEFKINPDILERTCFTIEVMHNTSPALKQDKMIGRIDIGGPLVSRGKELDHWNEVMLHRNYPVKEWHYLKHLT